MKKPRQWYRFQALADGLTADVNIYDEIGPSFCGEPTVSAKSFIDELDALPPGVKTIRVHVNSPGGDVWDALTIANRLKAQREEKGRTVEVLIEGVAASAATIITCAGNPIRVADNALMMIHNPRMGGRGCAADLRKAADMLDTVRNSIIATYRWINGKSVEELGAMLDAETWMDAAQAVADGFAHEVVSGVSVTASLRESSVDRLGEIPEQFRPRVAAMLAPPAVVEPPPAPPVEAPPASVAAVPQPLTRDLLASEALPLLAALLDEGKAAGIVAERQRLQSLDALALPGQGELLAEAKDGAEPMTPEAFAMATVKAEREKRGKYLADAATDAAGAVVPAGGMPPSLVSTADDAERNRLVKIGAEAGSTRRK